MGPKPSIDGLLIGFGSKILLFISHPVAQPPAPDAPPRRRFAEEEDLFSMLRGMSQQLTSLRTHMINMDDRLRVLEAAQQEHANPYNSIQLEETFNQAEE